MLQPFAKSKSKGSRDEPQPRKLTHAELQAEIKKLVVQEKWPNKQQPQKFIDMLDEIWRIGSRTYKSSSFTASFDPESNILIK